MAMSKIIARSQHVNDDPLHPYVFSRNTDEKDSVGLPLFFFAEYSIITAVN